MSHNLEIDKNERNTFWKNTPQLLFNIFAHVSINGHTANDGG